MSGLKQSVFSGEPLHTLLFQELHGSPVDLATVLGTSLRPHLYLDVLEPQIYGEPHEKQWDMKGRCFMKMTLKKI